MEMKIPIWNETIPYNTGLPKWDALKVDPNMAPWEAMGFVFDPEHNVATSTVAFDTAVWHNAILRGRVSRNFDDVPYLTPYVVEGSDICVLLCAGGAYIDVSTEDESAPVARELNRHGITAFTLNYRIYPYTAPAMFLDCRRAICWLRHHAAEFGFDPNKLCLGGFSAGGNLAATTANLFVDLPQIPGYTPDEVDREPARPNALLLGYPKVIFTDTSDLLIPVLGDNYFQGDRQALVQAYTIPFHMTGETPPTFLFNSQNDTVVHSRNLFAYAQKLHELGVPYEMHSFLEGGHGYGSAKDREYSPWAPPGDYRGTDLWTDLFAIWLEKIFRQPGQRNYK